MNNDTRKKIREIYTQIEGFTETGVMKEVMAALAAVEEATTKLNDALEKAGDAVNDFRTEVEEMQEAEQEKFDNMPEGLQQSGSGQAVEAAAEALGRAWIELDALQAELEDQTDIGGMWDRIAEGIQPILDNLEEAAQ